jgi:hypothetical protein
MGGRILRRRPELSAASAQRATHWHPHRDRSGEAELNKRNREEILMARFTNPRLAEPDDPIFSEGLTVFTPRSVRASTPSTKSSETSTASPSAPGSPAQTGQAPASKQTSSKEV